MTNPVNNLIAGFPMGPKIREWLGISQSQYRGHENSSPSAEDIAAFTDAFLLQLEDTSPKDESHLVDLLEELVGMNMPLLGLKLVDAYPKIFPSSDFRAQLHLGNSAMLIGDLSRAEIAFIDAQKIVPEEPAPYVNLAQIYCHDGLLEKARKWCDAGLDADPNNTSLWELIAWIEQQVDGHDAATLISVSDRVGALAKLKHSWAGIALACDLNDPEDVLTKSKSLEKFWDEGLRDNDFLVEFTAVLGMAGQYDRIPSIIWQAEKRSSQELPWQLNAHLAQAYLGLGRDEEARQALAKLINFNGLPQSAQQAISFIKAELDGMPVNG